MLSQNIVNIAAWKFRMGEYNLACRILAYSLFPFGSFGSQWLWDPAVSVFYQNITLRLIIKITLCAHGYYSWLRFPIFLPTCLSLSFCGACACRHLYLSIVSVSEEDGLLRPDVSAREYFIVWLQLVRHSSTSKKHLSFKNQRLLSSSRWLQSCVCPSYKV